MNPTKSNRLDDLEILVAHQSRMLDDLNEVIVDQGKTIAELRRKLEILSGRIEEFEAQTDRPAANQKPPHW